MDWTWGKRKPDKRALLTVGAAGLAGFLIARGAWAYRSRLQRLANNDLALEMADAGMYMLYPHTSVQLVAPYGEYDKGMEGNVADYDGQSYTIRFFDGRQLKLLVGELAEYLKIKRLPGEIHWAFA